MNFIRIRLLLELFFFVGALNYKLFMSLWFLLELL
jgi:hypothetical protein